MTDKKPSPETRKKQKKAENTAENTKIKPKTGEREEEFGGQEGPEPTRYGDWEKGGRCTDF